MKSTQGTSHRDGLAQGTQTDRDGLPDARRTAEGRGTAARRSALQRAPQGTPRSRSPVYFERGLAIAATAAADLPFAGRASPEDVAARERLARPPPADLDAREPRAVEATAEASIQIVPSVPPPPELHDRAVEDSSR